MDTSASEHVPELKSERNFRRFEHLLRAYAAQHPKPLRVDTGNLAITSFVCRLRGAKSALLDSLWDPQLASAVDWRSIAIRVRKGQLYIEPRRKADLQTVPEPMGTIAGGTAAAVHTVHTVDTDDLHAIARLLSKRIITEIRVHATEQQIEDIIQHYDIAPAFNPDGSVTLF